MVRRLVIVIVWSVLSVGLIRVGLVEAVPAFVRQYDVQCNACHTRPPRLNSFGEQFHLMGFQMPSAARPGGLLDTYKEDGPLKVLLDSFAIRAEGGIFECTFAPHESETKFAPPDEITLYITRAITPDLTFFVELEYAPNAVAFANGRYFTESEAGVGHEAFFAEPRPGAGVAGGAHHGDGRDDHGGTARRLQPARAHDDGRQDRPLHELLLSHQPPAHPGH